MRQARIAIDFILINGKKINYFRWPRLGADWIFSVEELGQVLQLGQEDGRELL